MASKLPLQNNDNVAKAPASSRAAAGKTIEQINQQLERILLSPESYIGSIEKHTQTLWVYEKEEMVYRSVTYVPGLYKIFDEILVRAAGPYMYSVKVVIDVEKNQISVCNSGVPLEIHQEKGVYVPEMIFGGRNGYGAKLTNIFSTEFIIEIADGMRRKKYKQVFENNMGKKSEPVITKCNKSENWTKITFKPDLKKFNMTELENDVVALMKKRVFDIAGCLGKTVKVELNGKRVPITDSDQNSIPSMVDGLKPSQRKILFCAFKENLVNEANVYHFSCNVACLSAYHHGVESIASTIISMAQDYVGSNNVNLLQPNGQFGTRTSGGKDAPTPIYIYTKLSLATRVLFPKDDDVLLDYLNDEDGEEVEPTWYMPIIPTVLVNGAEGTGSGWSTFIPNYNPRKIVANIRRLINGDSMVPMVPWYRGFKGTIEESSKESGSYTTTGLCEVVNETTLRITELPIGKWTDDYIQFLKSMKADNGVSFIQSINQNDGDYTSVDFDLILGEENMMAAQQEGFLKKFKLTTTIATSNMHLFNKKGVIKKYATPEEILEEFFDLRLEYYNKRKQIMLKNMNIKLGKLKKEAQALELRENHFTEILGLPNAAAKAYHSFLLSMSVEATNTLKEVRAQIDEIGKAFEELEKATPRSLWLNDLEVFDMELDELDQQDAQAEKERKVALEKIRADAGVGVKGRKQAPKKPAPKKTTKKASESETTETSNLAMDTDNIVAEVVKPKGRQGAKKKAPAAKEVEEDDTLDVKQGLAQYNFGSAPGDSSKTTETSKAISLDDDDEDVVVEVAPAKKGGRKPAAKPPADPRKRGKQPMFLKSSSEEEEAGNSSSEISGDVFAETSRPQRVNRRAMTYVLSDSESESGNESEFDDIEDDEDDE